MFGLFYSIFFLSLLFALLLRGKEKFPNVRKISFPLERILQGHHWNPLSSAFSGCLRTPQHGMEYVVWMYTFFGERVHSWPPVLQRVYEAKKKLWTTDTRPGLLTFDEVHASSKWEFGFGTVAGPVPRSPHPGPSPALEPVFPHPRSAGSASKSERWGAARSPALGTTSLVCKIRMTAAAASEAYSERELKQPVESL